MKRFFKTGAACALALALMSTSAFAAVEKDGSKVEFGADGKLNVTVAGTTEEEQVALLVLKGNDKTEANLANVQNTDIAYIDQKAGAASLTFSDINVGETTAVTVFAGSTNTAKAILLGTATAKQYSLTASAKNFNVAAGVETAVELTLTDQENNKVTVADAVTYKLKDASGKPADAIAAGVVANVSETSWKFNFTKAGTYDVVFTKNGVTAGVVVCVYDKKLPTTGFEVEGEGTKQFVMKASKADAKGNKNVVAAVRVTLAENQTGAGTLIWSITTADGAHYFTTPKPWDITGLAAGTPVDFGCKFVNDTKEDVSAVNVIYKDAAGKVFFTDPTDADREDAGSEEQK